MKTKTIKLFAIFCIIFSFSLQNAKAAHFSTTKFYLEWDSSFSGAPDEFRRIQDSFKIKNPDLSGLNDENIAKKSEKDVEQGEMKLLENAESPEEFKADNKTLTREKIYPNQPTKHLAIKYASKWLL